MSEDKTPDVPKRIETSDLEDTISELSRDSSADTMADLRQKLDLYKAAIRELDRRFNEKLHEWLDANQCELEVGNRRYYVGTETERWCKDNARAIEAILTASGGDFDAVARCISGGKSAWKYAQVKKVLGEQFGQYFGEQAKKDTKTGKPRKTVKEANDFTRAKQ